MRQHEVQSTNHFPQYHPCDLDDLRTPEGAELGGPSGFGPVLEARWGVILPWAVFPCLYIQLYPSSLVVGEAVFRAD